MHQIACTFFKISSGGDTSGLPFGAVTRTGLPPLQNPGCALDLITRYITDSSFWCNLMKHLLHGKNYRYFIFFVLGKNLSRQNIPDKIYMDKTYRTKYNGQEVPGQNIPDNMYRTNHTGQIYLRKYTRYIRSWYFLSTLEIVSFYCT